MGTKTRQDLLIENAEVREKLMALVEILDGEEEEDDPEELRAKLLAVILDGEEEEEDPGQD